MEKHDWWDDPVSLERYAWTLATSHECDTTPSNACRLSAYLRFTLSNGSYLRPQSRQNDISKIGFALKVDKAAEY